MLEVETYRLAIFHITIGATLYECYKEIERGRAGAILRFIWFDPYLKISPLYEQ